MGYCLSRCVNGVDVHFHNIGKDGSPSYYGYNNRSNNFAAPYPAYGNTIVQPVYGGGMGGFGYEHHHGHHGSGFGGF